ncbi:MAG: type II toxin-antitoxin system VapC family toxin [Leptolyngbyaceae cyanobacterium]
MNAVIVDTGPLYAEIDQSDQYHQQARSQLMSLNQNHTQLIIPYPIFLESHKLVLYKCGNYVANVFVNRIKSETNLVNPTVQDYQLAHNLLSQFPDQKITLFDAIVAILSQQFNIPVWTYDYHFDIMGIEVWR